jgi:hypothetical protein
MTIDVNAAGVLAQVIPALLVFLALEDRLSPALIPGRTWRNRLMRWREFAVVANLISLGLCLYIVVTKVENFVLSLAIVASVAFLLVVLAMLFAGMFGREDETATPAVDTTT